MSILCGTGAYSKVYRAGEEVIKVNLKRYNFFGIRYPAEYDITCRLRHPNLLSAKRITQEGYLVFDYYPYTLFSKEIQSLPFEQKTFLLSQLLSGVSALHESGYLHLDIKFDNVLVSENKQHLVLADFGSALFIGRDKGKSSSRNRIIDCLKSPEHLKSRTKKDKKFIYRRSSDYWSLGILLLRILAGEAVTSVAIYDSYKRLFKTKAKEYIAQCLPDHPAWQEIISGLLEWNWQERHLPILHTSAPLSITPSFSLIEADDLKDFFHQAIISYSDNSGEERVEAFFLATNLFRRVKRLQRDINVWTLLRVCYWIGLKIVEGASVDPREIDPDLEELEEFAKIELLVVREVNGILYPPNLFNEASSLQDLLVAWNYLYRQGGTTFLVEPCPKKVDLTLNQYIYFLDL